MKVSLIFDFFPHQSRFAIQWLCVIFFQFFFLTTSNASGPPAAVVNVVVINKQTLTPIVWLPGTIVSRDDARIAAEIPGRLVDVKNVGSSMQQGDIIAKIDNTLPKSQLNEAQAIVARELARSNFLETEVSRLQRLSSQNSAAKNRLDQAIADREIAKNNLIIARAKLDQAQDQLRHTQLRAPFAGVITERIKKTGERVDNGDVIVRLVNPKNKEVKLSIPGSSLSNLKLGDKLKIKSASQTVLCTVTTIVPVGDDHSRLYDVRLSLPTTTLTVGQTVRVAIPTAIPRNVLAVPRDALVLRRSGTSVYRINSESTAESIVVTTGIASGMWIEVNGDLSPGDKVVTRGGERLRPGQKVTIIANDNR